MTDRHLHGMESAVNRLSDIREELERHRENHPTVIAKEVEKIERKMTKITRKIQKSRI
jgi:hypothetical protein